MGTPVATLAQVYGDALELVPENPDNPPTFALAGVDFRGALSSAEDGAAVISLFTAACAGP